MSENGVWVYESICGAGCVWMCKCEHVGYVEKCEWLWMCMLYKYLSVNAGGYEHVSASVCVRVWVYECQCVWASKSMKMSDCICGWVWLWTFPGRNKPFSMKHPAVAARCGLCGIHVQCGIPILPVEFTPNLASSYFLWRPKLPGPSWEPSPVPFAAPAFIILNCLYLFSCQGPSQIPRARKVGAGSVYFSLSRPSSGPGKWRHQ